MRVIDGDALCKTCMIKKGSSKCYSCVIYDAPTINPETLRPKGEWIMRGGKLYCSHCGERAAVARDRDDFWYTKGTDACPTCGADMRGEQNER